MTTPQQSALNPLLDAQTASDGFDYEFLRIGATLPQVRAQFEDFAGRCGYDITWGELPSGYLGYLKPDTAKAFHAFHGGMRVRAPAVTMDEGKLLELVGKVAQRPDGYTLVQFGQLVLAEAQAPAALTYDEGVQEGIRRAFDLLMFGAVNTDDDAWSDRIGDLALDVLEYAPDYKIKWKEITALHSQIAELKKQLALAVAPPSPTEKSS